MKSPPSAAKPCSTASSKLRSLSTPLVLRYRCEGVCVEDESVEVTPFVDRTSAVVLTILPVVEPAFADEKGSGAAWPFDDVG